ncbi:hypothetical protein SAMN04488057_12149 [Cyclobacterium lianum]|uniref:Uncharacterized protein n=1 Tax=Cyclobacterium lianum TaxID=388280 RepID=A0A1M7QPH6_9BACT|nr:hypothetical protein [Cyclobacterium lianum]SHN33319.1 hypothetical protein SAMN04488057_12149 [Cyclobacterium lianum]
MNLGNETEPVWGSPALCYLYILRCSYSSNTYREETMRPHPDEIGKNYPHL